MATVTRAEALRLLAELHEKILRARAAGEETSALFACYDQAAGFVVMGEYSAAKSVITSGRSSGPPQKAPRGEVLTIAAVRRRAGTRVPSVSRQHIDRPDDA